MTQSIIGPVTPKERFHTIDIIRGLAVFGILVVNLTVDNSNVSPMEGRTGIADQLVYWPIKIFMDDKFMAIYSFLFGLTFTLIMFRAEAKGSSFVFLYIRRLLALALIAAAHIIFVGRDVLFDYALLGFLLLLVYKLNKKLILALSILCILIPWTRSTVLNRNIEINRLNSIRNEVVVDSNILETYVGVYEHHNGNLWTVTRKGTELWLKGRANKFLRLFPNSATTFTIREINNQFSFESDSTSLINKINVISPAEKFIALRTQKEKQKIEEKIIPQSKSNNYLQRVSNEYKQRVVRSARQFWGRISNWLWWKNIFWRGVSFNYAFPLFLLGLYAGRRKIFNDISSNLPFIRRVMNWGFLFGIAGITICLGFDVWNYIKSIKPDSYSYLTNSLIELSWQLGVLLMALAYISGLTIAIENENWKKRLSFLIPVGRMGLTNYILQSIANMVYFVGLNNPDKFGPFWRVIYAFVVFALIILISRWWFKYFRFGPLEWLWRSLTYLKFQPMRLKASNKNEEKEIESV